MKTTQEQLNDAINMVGLANVVVVHKDIIAGLAKTLMWMLKDIDYRNEQLEMKREDSAEVGYARLLLKELRNGIV